MRLIPALVAATFACLGPALASDITVTSAWAPPSLTPDAGSGAIYFKLHNGGTAEDSIASVSTPAAEMSMAHVTVIEDGVAKMKELGDAPIPAGTDMVFAPGGNHIMIMGLKKPLMAGDHFPLMLKTKRGDMLTIDVAVQKEAPAP